ncbi:hypothetical protein Acr_00g0011230 [Actinidia rufa]|uniref:Integrase zinc-binding domain-containing protein n=1 Tax=Actinidia rufa TaxID=165716 RepID=A0A7J0DB77_9ERIC|nr:hypothetical protein Acr_00g0011230 [Actinidia rufa]
MHYRLTEMVNTRSSGQGNRVNANTQMDELRDMMQTLVGAMATQQQLLQQHLQPPQPQQPRDQYSDGGENQTRGETSEYRGETEDPAIPVENVAIVKQFLKLKPPTFSGEMDPVKANEWLLEMEKNFRLLRCGEQQKSGDRLIPIDWEKYVPRALQNAKCAEFEHLKQTGKPIAEYEAAFTNLAEYAPHLVATDEMRARRFEDGLRYEIKRVIRPLVLPTYADVLDRAIIVEQDEIGEEEEWVTSERNCPKLGTGAIVPREIKEEEMPDQEKIVRVIKAIEWQWEITKDRDKCLPLCQAMRGNDEVVVAELNKKPEPLGYELAVSQPTNKGMVCSTTVYRDCSVCIGDTVIPTDLIPLEIGHFDVIFRMDWLSRNGTTIHCPDKCVIFQNSEQQKVRLEGERIVTPPYFVSMARAQRLLRKGCRGYLCSVMSSSSEDLFLTDIPVVCEFPERDGRIRVESDLLWNRGLCATIIAEPAILEEIKLRQMEDPKLRKIHDNLAAEPNSEFKVIDGVFKFRNRICVPNISDLKRQIMDEGHKTKWAIHPGMMKMYQDLKEMYWWIGMKRDVREYVNKCLQCQQIKASSLTTNSYQASIGMAPFEALYGRKCRSPSCWTEVGETENYRARYCTGNNRENQVDSGSIESGTRSTEKVMLMQIEENWIFQEGDWVFLKISPMKGVVRFGKKGKLNPRIGKEFANMRRRPVRIMDSRVKQLRNKSIPLVKVWWENQTTAGEATWEKESDMRQKYPHLFELGNT